MNIAKSVEDLVGNTPLVRLNTISQMCGAEVLAKCEFMNPTSSVKDRVGVSMIKQAQKDGLIDKNTTIIEPTSGNTGIALASVCASEGLKLILTMPESMSVERRKLLKIFGAKLVLTPTNEGMNGSIKKADELQKQIPNSIVLQQFKNKANPQAHEQTTALEILKDTDGKVDAFVSVVGTGGTLTGTSRVLKQKIDSIKIFAVEPQESAVLSGESAGVHKIQGIGAGFIPDIVDVEIFDEVVKVRSEDAIKTAKLIAQKEGFLVGISAGANVFATMQVARKFQNKTLVTVLCDTGERYISTELFDE